MLGQIDPNRIISSAEISKDGNSKEVTVYRDESGTKVTRVVGFVIGGPSSQEMCAPNSPYLSKSPLFERLSPKPSEEGSPERLEESHPVIVAIDKGDVSGLQKELVNARDANGMSLLERAVSAGKTPVAQWLITNGADVSVRSKETNEPMPHLAVRKNDLEMIRALLNTGAAREMFRYRDKGGFTPFHLAIQLKREDIMKEIHAQTSQNIRNHNCFGTMPLHTAAENGFEVAVEFLLRLDPWVANFTDLKKSTPLHLAIDGGHSKVVDLLFEHTTSLDQQDCAGDTVLHLAARKKDVLLCQKLLQRHADAFILNEKKERPHTGFLCSLRSPSVQSIFSCNRWVEVPSRENGKYHEWISV